VLDLLSGFVAELRTVGLPVSMTEHVDAARALEVIDLGDRTTLQQALRAVLVKNGAHLETFDHTFALYFGHRFAPLDSDDDVETMPATSSPSPAPSSPSANELDTALLEALDAGDLGALRASASLAVDRYAGIEKGRPVGASYYLYRTMRHLNIDEVEQQVAERRLGDDASPLEQRLAEDYAAEAVAAFRDAVEQEIIDRLVDERGVEAMVKATRESLPEDVDVMLANRESLEAIEAVLAPLGKKLAARLAQKRRRRRRGPVDMRRTMRESLSTGGVPLDIRFRPPRPSKPEIVVIADMSGSVASFARFTLLLMHALSSEFAKVRTFVFVDGVDEVTHLFDEERDPTVAADRIANEAAMIAADGHSDYGRVFRAFADRYADAVHPRSTLLILGDARSNYHPPEPEVFAATARRARRVYWLNPEPQAYWRSGDSVLDAYAEACDEVRECRTLRQLEQFVMGLS